MPDDLKPTSRIEIRVTNPLAALEKVGGMRTNPNSIGRHFPGDTWGETVYGLKDRRIDWPPT